MYALILANVNVMEVIVPLIFWLCVLMCLLTAVLILLIILLIRYVKQGLEFNEDPAAPKSEKKKKSKVSEKAKVTGKNKKLKFF